MMLQEITGFSIGLSHLYEILAATLVAGGLMTQTRFNTKRLEKLEEQVDRQRADDQKAMKDALDRIEARSNEKHVSLEAKTEKLEARFLTAIEKLGDSMALLTTRLETVVGIHETRLSRLEDK